MALFAPVPAASRARKTSAQMGYWSAIFGNKHWPRFGKAALFGRCVGILYREAFRKSAVPAPCTGQSKSEGRNPKNPTVCGLVRVRISFGFRPSGFRPSEFLSRPDFHNSLD